MREELISGSIAVLVYLGTLNHQFVYDDRKAVLSNPGVVGRGGPWSLLASDFWGVPLSHPGSHKSYRPLTSLTYRLDWWLSPEPSQFHRTNVLLHGLASALLVTFARDWVSRPAALLAGVLFAVHPIHTEAVAGVVGRAEVLACILFLGCLLQHRRRGWSWCTLVLAALSMLAKEQGITVLLVCALTDILGKKEISAARKSVLKLGLSFVILLSVRSMALKGNLPSFSRSDNPASRSESIETRTLTFLLLPVLNFKLLLLPSQLSYDWSMDSVPLVTSLLDPRNLLSALFYTGLAAIGARVMLSLSHRILPILSQIVYSSRSESFCLSKQPDIGTRKIDTIQVMALSLSLVILPFLPATNLFFYVGFVLAERVLYLPSLGYCLLLSYSLETLAKLRLRTVRAGTLLLLVFFTLKTLSRNRDWTSEATLFSSGIRVNPAKSWSNYGNVLGGQGNLAAAEAAFKEALCHRSNMADTHYNLGVLLHNQQRVSEAVACYTTAVQYRPQLALAHLNLGLALAQLGRRAEAMNILERCSQVDDNGVKDPSENINARISSMFHLGKLLLESGDPTRAISILHRAANLTHGVGSQEERRQTRPPALEVGGVSPRLEKILNLVGEAHQQLGNTAEAEYWYSQSLRANPKHVPAHLTLAKMLAKNDSRVEEAEQLFQQARSVSPGNSAAYVHYGLFLIDKNRFAEAATNFELAVRLEPGVYDYVFNLAVAARLAGQLDLAEQNYRRAVDLRPGEAEPHLNFGALLHLRGRLEEAEEEYITAWRLRPGDSTTRINLDRLHNLMRKKNMRVKNVEV